MSKTKDNWFISYANRHYDELFDVETFSAKTEADAKAEMVCYLIENKLITL